MNDNKKNENQSVKDVKEYLKTCSFDDKIQFLSEIIAGILGTILLAVLVVFFLYKYISKEMLELKEQKESISVEKQITTDNDISKKDDVPVKKLEKTTFKEYYSDDINEDFFNELKNDPLKYRGDTFYFEEAELCEDLRNVWTTDLNPDLDRNDPEESKCLTLWTQRCMVRHQDQSHTYIQIVDVNDLLSELPEDFYLDGKINSMELRFTGCISFAESYPVFEITHINVSGYINNEYCDDSESSFDL